MNQTDLAYLPIAELRKMSTEEIRQVQLKVNAILENQILMPSVYAEEFNRLLGKCARVLGERHKRDDTPQLLLFSD